MSNIIKAFENKKALIGFIMAGDPDLETTKKCIISMSKAGATMVELGIPFSDPIAESSIIQSANIRALKSGTYLNKIFETIKDVRKESDVQIVFHSYINPIFNYGYENFFKMCKETNVGGIIIPDLPFEEKAEIKEYADKYDIDIISFIVPSPKERIKQIATEATGFIYFVPSIGSTKGLEDNAREVHDDIEYIKSITKTPIAIGFGINTPAQAEYFSKIADGIIIGNAIVKIIEKNGKEAPEKVFEYIKEMDAVLNWIFWIFGEKNTKKQAQQAIIGKYIIINNNTEWMMKVHLIQNLFWKRVEL